MEAKAITETLSVSAQITAADVADIKKAGFRSIICNRPDGEGDDQPAFEEIEAAAEVLGLEVRHQPVVTGKIEDDDANSFGELVDRLPKPVLAYCRTGTRSAILWALSERTKRPLPDILERTKTAGYDLGGMAERIAGGGRSSAAAEDAEP